MARVLVGVKRVIDYAVKVSDKDKITIYVDCTSLASIQTAEL